MKKKIKVEQGIDLATAECYVFARYWEDSEVNGVEDDAKSPKMPCVRMVQNPWTKRDTLAWCPIIDLDTGQITNWQKGVKASIHYKSCDENLIVINDRNSDFFKEYEGYVPSFLYPKECGYGDYVIMDIDENGYIQDFDNNLDDIFGEDEE